MRSLDCECYRDAQKEDMRDLVHTIHGFEALLVLTGLTASANL
jgi:hypothetical protein